MKFITFSVMILLIMGSFLLIGCDPAEETEPVEEEPVEEPTEEEPDVAAPQYDDGRYRGYYQDRGEEQVGVQFDIEDGAFANITFRSLAYGGVDYLGAEEGDEPYYELTGQHEQAIEYLIGQPVEDMFDLHNPGDFVDDIDGFTGATIRANKILSAIQDGLNRGLYIPANDFSREIGDYDDGRYRGYYQDRGEEQVGIQFDIEDGVFANITFRSLAYDGVDYLDAEEGDEPYYELTGQHEQAIEYLIGQPIEAIFDLYSSGDFVDDIDGFTGATIRANKIFSAIKDGLNRGLYSPANDFSREIGDYVDGRYRGIYRDRGEEQVGIQFDIEDGVFANITFRSLAYDGVDYLDAEEGDEPYYELTGQHEQAIEYLIGQPVEAIFDLHSPGDFVDDIDGFTGATIRANKIFSAIMNGLERGVYSY